MRDKNNPFPLYMRIQDIIESEKYYRPCEIKAARQFRRKTIDIKYRK